MAGWGWPVAGGPRASAELLGSLVDQSPPDESATHGAAPPTARRRNPAARAGTSSAAQRAASDPGDYPTREGGLNDTGTREDQFRSDERSTGFAPDEEGRRAGPGFAEEMAAHGRRDQRGEAADGERLLRGRRQMSPPAGGPAPPNGNRRSLAPGEEYLGPLPRDGFYTRDEEPDAEGLWARHIDPPVLAAQMPPLIPAPVGRPAPGVASATARQGARAEAAAAEDLEALAAKIKHILDEDARRHGIDV